MTVTTLLRVFVPAKLAQDAFNSTPKSSMERGTHRKPVAHRKLALRQSGLVPDHEDPALAILFGVVGVSRQLQGRRLSLLNRAAKSGSSVPTLSEINSGVLTSKKNRPIPPPRFGVERSGWALDALAPVFVALRMGTWIWSWPGLSELIAHTGQDGSPSTSVGFPPRCGLSEP